MPYLGAHMSISGGIHLAFERLRQVGGEALQIFSRNQRRWVSPPLAQEDIKRFGREWKRSVGIPVAIHASYLINLASPKGEPSRRSAESMAEEIRRAGMLGVRFVIIHPGWHLEAGVRAGLMRCVENLRAAVEISQAERVMVLLENTSGQGSSLGADFHELAFILERFPHDEMLGICLDTCHLLCSGYEIRTTSGYERTFEKFQEIVGIERLKFFHLNDSKFDLGSRRDRHEHIGKGCVGMNAFFMIINDRRFKDLPMVIETPKGLGLEKDEANLLALKALRRK